MITGLYTHRIGKSPDDVGRVLSELQNPFGFSMDVTDQRFRLAVLAACSGSSPEVGREYARRRLVAR